MHTQAVASQEQQHCWQQKTMPCKSQSQCTQGAVPASLAAAADASAAAALLFSVRLSGASLTTALHVNLYILALSMLMANPCGAGPLDCPAMIEAEVTAVALPSRGTVALHGCSVHVSESSVATMQTPRYMDMYDHLGLAVSGTIFMQLTYMMLSSYRHFAVANSDTLPAAVRPCASHEPDCRTILPQ